MRQSTSSGCWLCSERSSCLHLTRLLYPLRSPLGQREDSANQSRGSTGHLCTVDEDAGWEGAEASHTCRATWYMKYRHLHHKLWEEFLNYFATSCLVLTIGFPNSNSFHPMTNYSLTQWMKLRHTEVKYFAQDNTTRKWKSWEPGCKLKPCS